MAKQSNARRFGIDFGFGATAKSEKTLWKPLLVAAPLIGTALLLATGTQAQTSASTTPPAQTADTATVAPNPAPDAARKKGPKGRSGSGRTEAALEPDSAPAEERRREGPKGDSDSGRTEVPAPDGAPAEGRREGPKGDHDHGRTATTPLIIGALGAATVLALVVSSGNDRPASP